MSMQEGQAPAEQPPGSNMATEVVPSGGEDRISAREAANALSSYRQTRDTPVEQEATAASPAETAPEEPSTEQPTQEAQPEESAIEAPRSWSKEEKERFASFPRETQEYLARRENERDTALRRGQNEAAQLRQALEAEKTQIDGVRQQYEQILPALQAMLQQQQQGEFADIRTQADIDNLARNDWPRFAIWQAHQMKVQAVNQEMQAVQQRQQAEYTQKWSQFAKDEDNKFAAQATEMSNPAEAQKIATAAVTLLRDTGFSDDDLNKLWQGQASVSLRDHRLQLIIRDAVRYREAKTSGSARKVVAPPPKVLRPGTPAEKASERDQGLERLNNKLNDTGKWKDAAELLLARRAARR